MKSIEDIIDEVKGMDLKLETEKVKKINWKFIVFYSIGAFVMALVWFYNYNWFKDSNHLVDYSFLLYIGIVHMGMLIFLNCFGHAAKTGSDTAGHPFFKGNIGFHALLLCIFLHGL